jgi:hypothetical protein
VLQPFDPDAPGDTPMTQARATEAGQAVIARLGATEQSAPAVVNGVPQKISHAQARQALRAFGAYDAAVAAINAAAQAGNTALLDAWEGREDFHRNSAAVTSMAAALGLTGEQVDAMFVYGGGVVF